MARIRIKDIAERAGVSPASVSRYLNDRPGTMSEATRARIAAVVRETGYRPNNAARSLRLSRTDTVGVVLADARNPYSGAILEELSRQAAERGLSLMTSFSGNDPDREHEAVKRLVAAGVDGLIVNSCRVEGGESLAEESAQTPLVLLDRGVPGCDAPLVTSDNPSLMHGLIDEMTATGATRFLLLDETHATSAVRRVRRAAFERELGQRGLTGEVLALSHEANEAARTLASHVRRDGVPSSLIAINGLVFLRAADALRAAELSVPRDVLVATFDENPWNRFLFGGVTTAEQDVERIARTTLDLLASPKRAPRRTELAGRIIPRPSTRRE